MRKTDIKFGKQLDVKVGRAQLLCGLFVVIDKLFVEVIDGVVTANFLSQKEKQPFVRFAIRKLDILKIFLMMLWETKSLDNKKYIALSEKLNEIGRNLGG